MENYNDGFTKKASEKQIQALQRLGYAGDTSAMTMAEASSLIAQYSNRGTVVGQTPTTPQYQQPTQIRNTTTAVATTPKVSYLTKNNEEVEFDYQSMNNYLGLSLNQQEFQYFSAVCKNYKLNPFLKDIYAIKFGSQPATFIIDYKVLQQAADNDPNFDGLEKGVLYLDKNGNPCERAGDYILPTEKLIGAWCIVHRKDRNYAPKTYAMFNENCKYDKNGEPMSNWKTRPTFMIVKVAKAQALREAFPNAFSNNTYIPEEMDEEVKKSEERKNNSIEAVAEEQAQVNASNTPFNEQEPIDDEQVDNPNDWLNE